MAAACSRCARSLGGRRETEGENGERGGEASSGRMLASKVPVDLNKKIVLIRHAKSQAQNVSRGERKRSINLLDAKLSSHGEEEMRTLGFKVAKDPDLKNVDLICCSPLSRAIQTACSTFESADAKILLIPELAEFAVTKRMSGFENTGRKASQLKKDRDLINLPKFKDIDFSLVNNYADFYGDDWWSVGYQPSKSEAQIERVKKILLGLPFQRIAVVGHCCNLMKLLDTKFRVPNSVPIWCRLTVQREKIVLVREKAFSTYGSLERNHKKMIRKETKLRIEFESTQKAKLDEMRKNFEKRLEKEKNEAADSDDEGKNEEKSE